MASSLNLYQKLLKITAEVGKQAKTGRNQMQGYAFIEQSQVVAALRPLLEQYGVFIIPETINRNIDRFTNAKGGISVHANLQMRFTVVNADNPEERFVCEWDAAEAIDTSDKATNKAATAGDKYFKMKLFNISDKDDADSDSPDVPHPDTKARPAGRRAPTATAKQIEFMRSVARQISGLEETGDVDAWLAQPNVLGMEPGSVPVFKVSDAVTKIKSLKVDPAPEIDVDGITEADLDRAMDNFTKGVY